MEQLVINNFGGLKNITFDINTINLIIGPQASGKSIITKLLFYFKSFLGEIKNGVADNKKKREIDKEQINRFITFFPKDTWPKENFKIEYRIKDTIISFQKINNKTSFDYTDNVKDIIKEGRRILEKEREKQKKSNKLHDFEITMEFTSKFNKLISNEISETLSYNQIFIPAGRSFFSNLQSSIFSFLSSNKSLDPFLIQFGSIYENFKTIATDDFFINEKIKDKKIDDLIESVLNSNYTREKEKDYLVHSDNRKVNLSYASSGQQEILPLLLILKVLRFITFSGKGAVLYIEEPEAHLFPNAQRNVIRILARIFNSQKQKFQYFITTHSPYILSSYNNLMYAGYIEEKIDEKEKKELYNIIDKKEILSPSIVSAFSINSGKEFIKAINSETQLIDQNILDKVSEKISLEFGRLMELDN